MWWKKHKWKVVLPTLLIIVLATAFWYGGGAPNAQGWSLDAPAEVYTPEPAELLETVNQPDAELPVPEENQQPPEVDTNPINTSDTPLEDKEATPEPEPTALMEELVPSENPIVETIPESQDMVIDPDTGKDQFLTDPVPTGKPLPVEPQNATISETSCTCTISISCATILNNMDWLDPEKVELVPADGWILRPTIVTFYEGESVFNVLQRICKQNKIHMEFSNTPMYNSAYIEGIHNLYEFDCGEVSGWMYKVNEWFPNYGCSRYALSDGDIICWVYTCDLGADVGGSNAAGG